MHIPQTPGLAAVQNALLQVRMGGAAESCLIEMAPAESALISTKLKINFLAMEDSFLN